MDVAETLKQLASIQRQRLVVVKSLISDEHKKSLLAELEKQERGLRLEVKVAK